MARRVITYDEAFEIIENCKPKEMDLYLEAAAKENAIGIYTEMHNYINDNIVTLDYDVDLFTEAFAWDKSKGFWANIWAWICNVWDAFKQFFMSFFGKNEMISKEAAEKIKSTAESAAKKVEEGIQLDGEGIKALNELFEYMKNVDSKLKEEIDKIEKEYAEIDVRKDKSRQVVENAFSNFENTIKSIIETKGLIKEGAIKTKIIDFLNTILAKYQAYDTNVLPAQLERNKTVSIIGRTICAYTNVMTVTGGVFKHDDLANTKSTALENINNLLKIDTNAGKNAADQGLIMQVILSGIAWLATNVLTDAASNFDKAIDLKDYTANMAAAAKFDLFVDNDLEFKGNIANTYNAVIKHYNDTINKDIELKLPGIIKETMTLKVAELPSNDELKKNPVTDDAVAKATQTDNKTFADSLKKSIPIDIKAIMHASSLFVTYKMAGKAFLDKIYKLIDTINNIK